MKFGAFFLLQSAGVRPSPQVYQRALKEMVYADELGFDSIWLAEHHFSNYGYCPNPLPLAVKAAQATKRVRIGTAVLVLPFWHPLRLAEDVAMADVLTEGRLEVGVARGYQKYEFDRLGLDIEENRQRSEETLDVLLKALTTVGFSHEGQIYQIPETTTCPRPLQQPRPPVWLAASTKETIQSAVRRGLPLFTTGSTRPLSVVQGAWDTYQRARTDLGGQEALDFAVQQNGHVAPSDGEARQRMEHSLGHYRQANRLRFPKSGWSAAWPTPTPWRASPPRMTCSRPTPSRAARNGCGTGSSSTSRRSGSPSSTVSSPWAIWTMRPSKGRCACSPRR